MDIWNSLNGESSNSYSWYSSRIWLLKIGYFKLIREKEVADDWIWIIDHSVQWGSEKCLLILGIRQKNIPKNRALTYADVEPIELIPTKSSNGDIVYEQLTQATYKTGAPRAIVADGGSDLKLGIETYVSNNTGTIYIYDIKHQIALCIKKVLESDPNWQNFIELCAIAQRYMRQNDVAALAPPNQRSKARYMNVDILINWAYKVLNMTDETCQSLFNIEEVKRTLGWLDNYKEDIMRWERISNIATKVTSYIAKYGLSRGTTNQLKTYLSDFPHCQDSLEFQEAILSHVYKYECKTHIGEHVIGSSDIIESLFGKFKNLEKEQSSSGFTNLLLALPALVAETSSEVIKKALTAIKVKEVWGWLKEKIGMSVQAKRKEAFS